MRTVILSTIVSVSLLYGCSSNNSDNNQTKVPSSEGQGWVDSSYQYFGDTINKNGAIAADQLLSKLQGKDSLKVKLTGTVEAVCQKKGCWMKMALGNKESMRVSFKDYSFFVPKDCGGKTAIIEGVAYRDTTTIVDLKHYAEDAGKSKDEIAQITKPEINIGFEAHGVLIKK